MAFLKIGLFAFERYSAIFEGNLLLNDFTWNLISKIKLLPWDNFYLRWPWKVWVLWFTLHYQEKRLEISVKQKTSNKQIQLLQLPYLSPAQCTYCLSVYLYPMYSSIVYVSSVNLYVCPNCLCSCRNATSVNIWSSRSQQAFHKTSKSQKC